MFSLFAPWIDFDFASPGFDIWRLILNGLCDKLWDRRQWNVQGLRAPLDKLRNTYLVQFLCCKEIYQQNWIYCVNVFLNEIMTLLAWWDRLSRGRCGFDTRGEMNISMYPYSFWNPCHGILEVRTAGCLFVI